LGSDSMATATVENDESSLRDLTDARGQVLKVLRLLPDTYVFGLDVKLNVTDGANRLKQQRRWRLGEAALRNASKFAGVIVFIVRVVGGLDTRSRTATESKIRAKNERRITRRETKT